jgi:putative DNA primase/helicase
MSATPCFGRPGVSDETLASAGVHHVSEPECQQRYGFRAAGIAIPFFALNGEPVRVGEHQFVRVRLYEARIDQKYAQAKDSGVHLYIPPALKALPAGGTLILTEGEFKALALVEAGFNAVGLCGLCGACQSVEDNDTKRHVLLPELRAFLQERSYARLVFLGDADVVLNHHFAKEAAKLAKALADFKLEVRVAKTAFGGPKGVDDFRQEHKAEFTEKFEQVLAESLAVNNKEAPQIFASLLRREEEPLKECFKAKAPEDTYDQRRKLLQSAAAFAAEPILGQAIKEMVAAVFGQSVREVNKTLAQLTERAESTAPAVSCQINAPWQEDVEPWPEPVDGKQMMRKLVHFLGQLVVTDAEQVVASALWIIHAHAHAYDCFQHSPRLLITSPTKRCGKSRLLAIIKALVPRPLTASNCSTASLFRAIEEYKPTVLLDEADTFVKENEELRGLINAGFEKSSAFFLRCVGDNHQLRSFRVWAPMAIAAIGNLPDTIVDRSIVIRLQRATGRLDLGPLPEQDLLQQNRVIARWIKDHFKRCKSTHPDIPKEITSDRYVDSCRSLFAITDVIGGEWPDVGRHALVALANIGDHAPDSPRELLLRHIRQVFTEDGAIEMSTDRLLERLCGEAEWPWREYNHGRGLTPHKLAKMLKEFGIHSHTIGRGKNNERIHGYRLKDFETAFQSYCPEPPETEGGRLERNRPQSGHLSGHPSENEQVVAEQGLNKTAEPAVAGLADSNGVAEENVFSAEPAATVEELSTDESWLV